MLVRIPASSMNNIHRRIFVHLGVQVWDSPDTRLYKYRIHLTPGLAEVSVTLRS